MIPMRQRALECKDQEKIDLFLEQEKTGFLGLADGNTPYVIPLNFVWLGGSIYFHGAAEGRKVNIMEENAKACFSVSANLGTLTHPVPAKTDTAYMSVMVFGEAELVVDLDEAVKAMQKMLDKYVPGYYEQALSSSHVEKYRSSLGSKTSVYKIKALELSAKENPIQLEKLFYNGKTQHHESTK
ncbi:pyridoxamine 5'-phosphate oxidase family protein [Bacillus sp. UNC438CL73TsuS30]|uniref:pyridoxamine 5'-phosphate oxidase family protein n=1 Tax=Bacillus sp. UNC438CL73TsuS30 TaxID=1340434 RepID=UPI00047D4242|nr:pyridoxamine 5'-phosphate oxidase family protein [Bacillus sp. UNC438CL73TsuS30]